MEKFKYSIVCCYNKETELNDMLLSSLYSINHHGNVFLIDTINRGYKRAAEAFNKEIQKFKDDLADIIIFSSRYSFS